MSIYVLRYGDLVKIGFSSDLPQRVKSIMQSIPGDVTFVGHMPGDEEVEAHFHLVFAAHRFSGEWFRNAPEIQQLCDIALIKSLPAPELRVIGTRQAKAAAQSAATSEQLREYALRRWPSLTHAKRREELATALGWLPSRLGDFYYGHSRAVLRATEIQQIDELLAPSQQA